jgi:type II pantothenate kinase
MFAANLVTAAIDFGISNTDVIAQCDGILERWSRPYDGDPTEATVRAILQAGGISLDDLPWLAATGGRHRVLPDQMGGVPVRKINEVQAIGRGGQALAGFTTTGARTAPLLVVSAGSGTAMIRAEGNVYAHVSGTAVGGGTMVGLAHLLLGTGDPHEIGRLAELGDRNGVDLSLADVITGPIGSLPATATAVNFGRVGRADFQSPPRREDVAAALLNLVAQTAGLMAVNVARAFDCSKIVVTGHMVDMHYYRMIVELVGKYYSFPIEPAETGGYGTALGALLLGEEMTA